MATDAEELEAQFNCLLDQLRDPANPDPLATTFELGGLAQAIAMPTLLRLLYTDHEVLVREVAVKALGLRDDPEVIPALIHALGDEVGVVFNAVTALGRLGHPTLQPLLRALEDEDSATRGNAAWALGRQRARQSVAALSRALADPDQSVRNSATFALAELGDRRVVAPLIEMLADPDWQLRSHAADAVSQYALSEEEKTAVNNVLLQQLRSSELMQRRTAVYALVWLPHRTAVPALIDALRDDDADIREEAAHALERIGDPVAMSPLVDVFRALPPVRQVANAAAHALGRFGEAALPLLLEAIEDADANVRFWAAIALGYTGLPQALPHLIALRDTDDGLTATRVQVRIAAARAIRHMQKHHQPTIGADDA
jgi:HEAT repeat protein